MNILKLEHTYRLKWVLQAVICLLVVLLLACDTPPGTDKDNNWFTQLKHHNKNVEQGFIQINSDSWYGLNKRHRLNTHISPIGLQITSLEHTAPDWIFGMRLIRIGRSESFTWIPEVTPIVDGAWVSTKREHITEWLVNTKNGVRVGYHIERSPSEGNPSSPLVLKLSLDTNLMPRIVKGDQAVELYTPDNLHVLRFHDLSATDSRGNNLSITAALHHNELHLNISDERALYPILMEGALSSTNEDYTGELETLFPNAPFNFYSGQEGANAGHSVATAGDVNGDGYSDILVSSYLYDDVGINEGRVDLYVGSPTGVLTTPAWTEIGNNKAALGEQVSTAGDVNGDGYSDVIIGTRSGRAYVYLGSPNGLGSHPAWIGEDDQSDSRYGRTVSTAGDVNGDGYDDVIVGAPRFDSGEADVGKVFLYLGSAGGLSTESAWSIEGDQRNSNFGESVATAGDVNGDGLSDIVIGASTFDADQSDVGRVFVYHGERSPSGLSAVHAWYKTGEQSESRFGASVATAGDVNGDGFSDLLVGAYHYDSVHINQGRVLLYMGSAEGLKTEQAWAAEGQQKSSDFGLSLTTAGDVNGDGYADIFISEPGYDNGQINEGMVHIYLGGKSPDLISTSSVWTREGNQDRPGFGISVATGGDINGDGLADVVVGAPLFDADETDEGKVSVFLSNNLLIPPHPSWSTFSLQADDWFGYSVSHAGDVNGDGYQDAIIGVPKYDNGEVRGGKAIVYLGTAYGLASTPHWIADGFEHGAQFGFSVATAGDVNGDGFSDIMVGAPGAQQGGKAYVWLGSETGLPHPGTEANAAWIVSNPQIQASFGHSVASAGDINGDGFSDVIIGAPLHDSTQMNEGSAFLYLGSKNGLSINHEWSAESDQPDAHLGWAVATAGDVNGDGYSDIVIGAPLYDHRVRADSGASFVWYGGKSNNGRHHLNRNTKGSPSNADWQNTVVGQFGFSVSSAGDLNGDGFSDIVVGAPYLDSGMETNSGAVYAFFGSATGLSTSSDINIFGDQLEAKLGWSVASIPNYVGRGQSVLLVGAPFYDYGTPKNAGRVLIIPPDWPNSYPPWESSLIALRALDPNKPRMPDPGPVPQFGLAVSSGGDINGDGLTDILVGSPYYDSRYAVAGQVIAYNGLGAQKLPQQLNIDNWGSIAALGKSDGETAFRIKMLGKSPAGRARVQLEWEAKQFGAPFDGAMLSRGLMWDTGVPDEQGSIVPLDGTVKGLEPGTNYHWRARILTDSPYFPRSPWFSLSFNNPTEKKLLTGGTKNTSPRAEYDASPRQGQVPLTVSFDGSFASDSDGAIYRYDWDFGDGNTAQGQVVSHTYNVGGKHVVSLTVTDSGGAKHTRSHIVIDVLAPDPVSQSIGPDGGNIVGQYIVLSIQPDALQENVSIKLREQGIGEGEFVLEPRIDYAQPAWLLAKGASGQLVKIVDNQKILLPSVESKSGILAPINGHSEFEITSQETGKHCPMPDCWLFTVAGVPELPWNCFGIINKAFHQYLIDRDIIKAQYKHIAAGATIPVCLYPEDLDSSIQVTMTGTTAMVTFPPHDLNLISHVYIPSKNWLRNLSQCSNAEADQLYDAILDHEMEHVRIFNTMSTSSGGSYEIKGVTNDITMDDIKRLAYEYWCHRESRNKTKLRHDAFDRYFGSVDSTGISKKCMSCEPGGLASICEIEVLRWELDPPELRPSPQCVAIGGGDQCIQYMSVRRYVNEEPEFIASSPCCWECIDNGKSWCRDVTGVSPGQVIRERASSGCENGLSTDINSTDSTDSTGREEDEARAEQVCENSKILYAIKSCPSNDEALNNCKQYFGEHTGSQTLKSAWCTLDGLMTTCVYCPVGVSMIHKLTDMVSLKTSERW